MKKNHVSLLLLLTIISILFISNTYAAEAVTTSQWYTEASDFKEVKKAAAREKKPYILFFYTDWCGYCKKMNRKYLSDEKVEQILSKYYRIKINPENGEEEGRLAQKKEVQGFPDFRIVHPDGRSIIVHPFQSGGSLEVDAFIKELKAALEGAELQ